MSIRAISSKRRSDFGDSSSETIILPGFFTERELESFSKLIQQVCSLPIFRGHYWQCYSCDFESVDLEKMAEHIITFHKSDSVDTEVILRQELALA